MIVISFYKSRRIRYIEHSFHKLDTHRLKFAIHQNLYLYLTFSTMYIKFNLKFRFNLNFNVMLNILKYFIICLFKANYLKQS